MRRADRISGVFWFIFAGITMIKSYSLGLGNLLQPGPGFLFFWAGLSLAIMSIAIILQTFRIKKTDESEKPIFGEINLTKIILVLIAVFLYALLLEWLGYIIVTTLLFIFILGVVEGKGWFFTIISSVIVTASSYLIFKTWLQTQLPAGILEFLRF